MEILKYLDVLIGFAVVMVLMSPMVSALTQIAMWAWKVRPIRLRLALATLIKGLNGPNFDLYDTAVVTGLPANVQQLQCLLPEPLPPMLVTVNGGVARIDQNVAAMLRANINADGRSDLLPALRMIVAGQEPQPVAGVNITLQPRGTQDFPLAGKPTGAQGETTVTYRYDGPIQFASRQFTAAVAPAGATVASITIDSGAFKGTQLTSNAAGIYGYPDEVRPMPTPHDLKIVVNNGQAGVTVTLNFRGDRSLDRTTPVAGAVGLFESEAKDLAGRVLAHPMIGKPPTEIPFIRNWEWMRWGEVVEREELIRILLEFAATDLRLRTLLAQNGIADPEGALADIRQAAQRLEREKPGAASHDRLTQAILEGAQSSFVGRINNWFDQVMDRTTGEYKFRAQLVTVAAALVVAFIVQLDSISLLRRLSTDDKLRDSLVQQADQQQARFEKQADKQADKKANEQTQGELELAKSRRDEIEANLAKLRDPSLGVLPDHFVWQRLPKARLMHNPAWTRPYAQRLELVVGSSVFPIEPKWTSDPVSDIEDAIGNSGAPVKLAREGRKFFKVTSPAGGPDIDSLRIRMQTNNGVVEGAGHNLAPVQVQLPARVPPGNYRLVVGDDWFNIATADGSRASLASAIAASPAPVVVQPGGVLMAKSPEPRSIELRSNPASPAIPASNALAPIASQGGSAFFDERLNADSCGVADNLNYTMLKPCAATAVLAQLKARQFIVSEVPLDDLVLISHRLGALQLRSIPGKSESNMLNRTPESSCDCFPICDKEILAQSWRGILLTWILLSLGAPFWYDTLKDLLKLRSSLAKKEEDARKERQETTPAAAATPAK